MSRKNLAINLGLLCGSIALFFLGIEFLLRITGLQTVRPNPPQIYQPATDPRISYELIPDNRTKAFRQTVTTNSLGFRSPEVEPDLPLVAMLGDSITFGYGVRDDETLAAQLQDALPEYQFLNAGTPGYQLTQETAVYQRKIAPLDPELLILVFHYNDLDFQTGWLDEDGILRAEDWQPSPLQCNPITTGILGYLPGKCWLDNHSAFYKAFKKLVNLRQMNQNLAKSREESRQQPAADDATEEQLKQYAGQLDELVSLLPPNMPRLFVIWPDRKLHQASRPQLMNIAEERGFVVVDFYETFGNEVETLGWDTVHPSAAAIEEAAGVIAKKLQLIL